MSYFLENNLIARVKTLAVQRDIPTQ